jgi:hypothetical protein
LVTTEINSGISRSFSFYKDEKDFGYFGIRGIKKIPCNGNTIKIKS